MVQLDYAANESEADSKTFVPGTAASERIEYPP